MDLRERCQWPLSQRQQAFIIFNTIIQTQDGIGVKMAKCLICKHEALSGYSKCQACLDRNVRYMRKKRATDQRYYERELEKNQERKDRYQAEGRCRRCSKKLDPDCDAGFIECLNCRERDYEYAKI